KPSDPTYDKTFMALSSVFALEVGLIQTVLGLLNAAMGQVKHLFGIKMTSSVFLGMVTQFFKNISDMNWKALLLGLGCMAILLLLSQWKRRKNWPGSDYVVFVPGALVVVVVATAISYAIHDPSTWKIHFLKNKKNKKIKLYIFFSLPHTHTYTQKIVGTIPKGFPASVNMFDAVKASEITALLPSALLTALISFVSSFSVAATYSEKRGYQVSPSQELIAVGVCNLIGAWFQGFVITGGFARSAVLDAAGSVTPLSSLVSGVFMIFALGNLFRLWTVKRTDFYVAMITFLCTLILGIEMGLLSGVIASVFMFIQRASSPHYAVLGEIREKKGVYKLGFVSKHTCKLMFVFFPPLFTPLAQIINYPDAKVQPDLLIIRWDASLFFGNSLSFRTKILKEIKRFKIRNPGVTEKPWALLLSFAGINDIDVTATQELKKLLNRLKKSEPELTILAAELKQPVRLILDIEEAISIIGEQNIYLDVAGAAEWWESQPKVVNNENPDMHRLLGPEIDASVLKNEKKMKEMEQR
ncbi:sulfate transporter family protein, partial [Reticulomyxa filosa]